MDSKAQKKKGPLFPGFAKVTFPFREKMRNLL